MWLDSGEISCSEKDVNVFDCFSKPLPQVKAGTHTSNDLDLKLAEYRKNEMHGLVSQAKKLRDTARDIHEALSEVETYLQTLINMAQEVRLATYMLHCFLSCKYTVLV